MQREKKKCDLQKKKIQEKKSEKKSEKNVIYKGNLKETRQNLSDMQEKGRIGSKIMEFCTGRVAIHERIVLKRKSL